MKDRDRGNRLKRLREIKKLSQAEVAPLIGVGYSSVQGHEGGRAFSKTTLEKYARFYGCDDIWLLTGRGHPYSGQEPYVTDDKPAPERPYKVEDAPPSYIDGAPRAARDKEGLWGDTKHIERGGARFSVTTHEPKKPGYEMGNGPAIDSLLYILQSDNHSIVRAILSNLEAFSGAIRDQNQAKARIERLESQNEEMQRRMEILEMKIEAMMKAPEEKKTQEPLSTKSGEQQSPQASSL